MHPKFHRFRKAKFQQFFLSFLQVKLSFSKLWLTKRPRKVSKTWVLEKKKLSEFWWKPEFSSDLSFGPNAEKKSLRCKCKDCHSPLLVRLICLRSYSRVPNNRACSNHLFLVKNHPGRGLLGTAQLIFCLSRETFYQKLQDMLQNCFLMK